LHSGWCRSLLELKPFLYLGRVSYSLYLLQMIVLICLAPRFMSCLNQLGVTSPILLQVLMLLLVTGVCLALADISERWIEAPCVRLGRWLSLKLEERSFVHRIRCGGIVRAQPVVSCQIGKAP